MNPHEKELSCRIVELLLINNNNAKLNDFLENINNENDMDIVWQGILQFDLQNINNSWTLLYEKCQAKGFVDLIERMLYDASLRFFY